MDYFLCSIRGALEKVVRLVWILAASDTVGPSFTVYAVLKIRSVVPSE